MIEAETYNNYMKAVIPSIFPPIIPPSFTVTLSNIKRLPQIKNVIFNDPATIVYWSDDTKTVTKANYPDKYDPEKGLAMAISKKALGNKGNFNEVFHKWIPKPEGVKTPNGTRVLNIDEIYIRHSMHESHPNPDKIHKCYSYYRKHGRFDRDIIVDENNVLVDGYCAYLVAKMFDEEYVRVVQES